jgi:hypothetical protein
LTHRQIVLTHIANSAFTHGGIEGTFAKPISADVPHINRGGMTHPHSGLITVWWLADGVMDDLSADRALMVDVSDLYTKNGQLLQRLGDNLYSCSSH